ncbi:MAG: molybdenum cofactor biosynthesis protein MoaE [Angustibacter sp.]
MTSQEVSMAVAEIHPRVRLAGLRDAPLSIDEVVSAVLSPSVGGVVVFIGTVRDVDRAGGPLRQGPEHKQQPEQRGARQEHPPDRAVAALDYSAHPRAELDLARVAAQVADRHEVVALAVLHRVGALQVGDVAVALAAGARHRPAAFAAARDVIDTLKATVPIWKHQQFVDGGTEWVGLP